jgi:hypothetical protein
MKEKQDTSDESAEIPLILLASDNPRVAEHLHRSLRQEGFQVHLAPGYDELEPLLRPHEQGIVLLEISSLRSVEEAVGLAIRIKRRNASQFVGYLADPVLHHSGLAGDAIFPRSAHHLPQALRDHFSGEA